MFKELKEKIEKSNDQRISMVLTLINVMNNSQNATIELRTAVAASMLSMLNTSMLPEDVLIVKLINEAIDNLCKEANDMGVPDLKNALQNIIKTTSEKMNRVSDGDSILNNINLN